MTEKPIMTLTLTGAEDILRLKHLLSGLANALHLWPAEFKTAPSAHDTDACVVGVEPVTESPVAVPTFVTPPDDGPSKRHRRTKAQIEADRLAEIARQSPQAAPQPDLEDSPIDASLPAADDFAAWNTLMREALQRFIACHGLPRARDLVLDVAEVGQISAVPPAKFRALYEAAKAAGEAPL